MKNKKILQKAICLLLAILIVWASGFATADDKQEIISLEELKKRYPHAQFISVSPEEFQFAQSRLINRSVMIVQTGKKGDGAINGYNDPSYAITTAEKILRQYPHTFFQGVRLPSFQVGNTFFETHMLVIALPQSFFIAENEDIPTLDMMKQNYPGTMFHLYHIRAQEALLVLQSQKKNAIAFIAQIYKTTETQTSTEIIYPPAPEDVQLTGSCVADLADNDIAVVLFVVIGVFIVAALIVYAGKFIYDVTVGNGVYEYWWEISPGFTIIENDTKYGFKESGYLAGLKLAAGFTERSIQFGLTGEAGVIDFSLYYEDHKGLLELEGIYGMVGPAIRFLFNDDDNIKNASYLYLELLGGTSEHEEAGLLSVARMGLNWRIQEHLRFGIHAGSLYFDLKESEGIIENEDNFRLMGGLEFGYRF
ncbi:MAG: hypothetical protein JW932_14585 [Deltaproteobacteria bacterium]|nr:hypothetical protein [Deltaproteobacteria bacterium]